MERLRLAVPEGEQDRIADERARTPQDERDGDCGRRSDGADQGAAASGTSVAAPRGGDHEGHDDPGGLLRRGGHPGGDPRPAGPASGEQREGQDHEGGHRHVVAATRQQHARHRQEQEHLECRESLRRRHPGQEHGERERRHRPREEGQARVGHRKVRGEGSWDPEQEHRRKVRIVPSRAYGPCLERTVEVGGGVGVPAGEEGLRRFLGEDRLGLDVRPGRAIGSPCDLEAQREDHHPGEDDRRDGRPRPQAAPDRPGGRPEGPGEERPESDPRPLAVDGNGGDEGGQQREDDPGSVHGDVTGDWPLNERERLPDPGRAHRPEDNERRADRSVRAGERR